MDKTPLILSGPPGCGKSYWIQKYAEQVHKQLFVCPCRKDRTLRDGRQKLHVWARRSDPVILWLEGADDLTPEAQAFLRRILETHANDVLFILECRDSGRLQEPIRSRCRIKKMQPPSWKELEQMLIEHYPHVELDSIRNYLYQDEYSYRRAHQCVYLQLHYPDEWAHVCTHRTQERCAMQTANPDQLIHYMKSGFNPEWFIVQQIARHPENTELLHTYGQCIDCAGSLWAFLGSAFDTTRTTPRNQEEQIK